MSEYDDIINLPHHVSSTRRHMTMIERAAQFSPFAALTGHSEAIEETARYTENAPYLDENAKTILGGKLQTILENINNDVAVSITYFRPDSKKKGGAYICKEGVVRRIDSFKREVVFTDGTVIIIDSIVEIESSIFNDYF